MRTPNEMVANVQDCSLTVSEFDLQSYYYVHFWINSLGKGTNSLIPQAIC